MRDLTTRLAIVALCLALAAGCGRKPLVSESTAEPVLPPSESAPCEVASSAIWSKPEFGRLRTLAETRGPNCANAVVLLTVRDEAGAPLLAWASPTRNVFGLADATTPDAMKTALTSWMRQDQAMLASSDRLPEWPSGAVQPASGEFPFYPEPWIDRAAWADIRAEKAPLFSFPQGRESTAVYRWRDGGLERIGVQAFPG